MRDTGTFIKENLLNESIFNTIIGILVVAVVALLIFNYTKSRQITPQITMEAAQTTNEALHEETTTDQAQPKEYTVNIGDSLWLIAENVYSNPYQWTAIASENKLNNPNVIFVGQTLIIPKPVQTQAEGQILSASSIEAIKDAKYTVVAGDTLWHIAERAYGTGYKWTLLAQANNLVNPDYITQGQILLIPR